jgi:hypothetical protein
VPPRPGERGERGSVTPLILGMVVCLLLLGAGVTAATSAFLARQRLQASCDGAAAAAADAAEARYYGGTGDLSNGAALDGAQRYLAARSAAVSVTADTAGGSVVLACTATSDIALGGLFGFGTATQTVQSVGRPVL